MRVKFGKIAGDWGHKRASWLWNFFWIGAFLGASLVLLNLSLSKIEASRIAMDSAVESLAEVKYSQQLAPTQAPAQGPAPWDKDNDRDSLDRIDNAQADQNHEFAYVSVYLTGKKKIETVPLETYVQGVLAGEMPIDFELEALKAQAIAARTYIVRRMSFQDRSGLDSASADADVLDTVQHQVYIPQAELEGRWTGQARKQNLAKLRQAVEETKGLVITYNSEPIQAAFFSTSNGYTENSEDYWEHSLPYLRSVASPWDENISPSYEETVQFTREQFYSKMGLTGKKMKAKPAIKVVERTAGNRIKAIEINGQTFSGREVRERLGLASSQFIWTIKKDNIELTTFGYGHGVGMSQWGANGMAEEGKTAEEIIHHYYTGSSVQQASKLPTRAGF